MKSAKSATIAALLAAAAGLAPILLYWVFIGSAPTVTSRSARELLAADGWVLVDLRSRQEFVNAHIKGARHWPFEDALAWRPGDPGPFNLNGNKLLVICGSGLWSARAAAHLSQAGALEARSVRGGMAAWYAVEVDEARRGSAYYSLQDGAGRTMDFPRRDSTFHEQLAVCASAFVVKPMYMLVSLFLFFLLRSLTAPDMRALKTAMLLFFAGEAFCAANYLLFEEDSYLMEYLHMLGMVGSFSFAIYALMEALDSRVLHFTDHASKCPLSKLCGECYTRGVLPCRLRQVFQFMAFAMGVLCIIPLLAGPKEVSYNTEIFGSFYNYTHQVLFQLYETRFAPAAALMFFAVALAGLTLKKEKFLPAGKLWVAAGGGLFGFGLLRQGLLSLYADNLVWFVCWEEITELIYVGAIALVLWVFRRTIFEGHYETAFGVPG